MGMLIFKGCQNPEMSSIPVNRHKTIMPRQIIDFGEAILLCMAMMWLELLQSL